MHGFGCEDFLVFRSVLLPNPTKISSRQAIFDQQLIILNDV
jgi:hypothetical protein